MALFQRKQKWSYSDFGKVLANLVKEAVLTNFENESSITSMFTLLDKQVLLKEWILFNLFEMFQGASAYFKNSEEGFLILDEFHNACSVIFCEADIFEDPSTFTELLISRYRTYSAALKETGTPNNPLWFLSKAFCRLCKEQEPYDIAQMVFVTHHFTEISIANKKLIGDLVKSVRIVK